MTSNVERLKVLAVKLFQAGVSSVLPHSLVRKHVRREGSSLTVMGNQFILQNNCYLVGFGKAVLAMSSELEKILGEHLVTGIISVPNGVQSTFEHVKDMLPKPNSVLKVMEGAEKNLPDTNAEYAASSIAQLVADLDSSALLFVTISGGGSALLPSPMPPISLADKLNVTRLLASSGASIQELNTVRKSLSLLKGGGLAQLAYPAQVITLILSDIVGDPLGSIASGPTVVNTDCEYAALQIIKKFSLESEVSQLVLEHLRRPQESAGAKTGVYNGQFCHVHNYVIGNNVAALENIAELAKNAGYATFILSSTLEGNVRQVAKLYSNFAVEICKFLCDKITGELLVGYLRHTSHSEGIELRHLSNITGKDFQQDCKKVCFILGGETTVEVVGSGLGGRNQELGLAFSLFVSDLMKNNPCCEGCNILLLSGGTDGIDGPTDFAGVLSYPKQVHLSSMKKIDPIFHLNNNDSTNFYLNLNNGEDLLKIGHTGTNVMDIHILLVEMCV